MRIRYSPWPALTITSAIFLLLGATCFLVIAADIVWRKAWQSMMRIMISVYSINATYMLPLELYVYFKFGRAAMPSGTASAEGPDPEKGHTSHDSSSNKDQSTATDSSACCQGSPPDRVMAQASGRPERHGCQPPDLEKANSSRSIGC